MTAYLNLSLKMIYNMQFTILNNNASKFSTEIKTKKIEVTALKGKESLRNIICIEQLLGMFAMEVHK
jgi:hypothetical protein